MEAKETKETKEPTRYPAVNLQHKDRLFCMLFGENKENLLSLYNAVNGTDYDDVESLEINTISDVIYMSMKNDVSCIFDNQMSLYEHQSTFNPNMPLRGLMYAGRLYDKFIKSRKINLYSSQPIKIPTPQYYVFYNGNDNFDDRIVLHLSDSFACPVKEGAFEWSAVMLNINYGRNRELMEKCGTLKEYSIFVSTIKEIYKEKNDIQVSVKEAVDTCIKKGVLASFLMAHKSEVLNVCLTEYDEQATLAAIANESREEGRKETEKQDIIKLIRFGRKHKLPDENIKESLIEEYNLSEEEAGEYLFAN